MRILSLSSFNKLFKNLNLSVINKMKHFEDYEDEIYYLRSQNRKYEQINNDLLMERNVLNQKYK